MILSNMICVWTRSFLPKQAVALCSEHWIKTGVASLGCAVADAGWQHHIERRREARDAVYAKYSLINNIRLCIVSS
jgi:hypothetical protein